MSKKSVPDIEREIIAVLLAKLVLKGYYIGVDDDGDELALEPTQNISDILVTLFAANPETLMVYPDACQQHGVYVPGTSDLIGIVDLVYGNEGWTVIADYSMSLAEVVKELEPLIEKYENDDRN